MTYKVLFLDIDGVLNSGKYIKRLDGRFDDPINQIDPDAVVRLNAITDLTGCKIVVSSTWRLAFLGQMAEPLRSLQGCLRMYNITGDVIGMTPNKRNCVRNQRGKEIESWLQDHAGQVDKFVIIDDDCDMGRMKPYHIKTLFEDGIQDAHVQAIVSILGMPL
jgi:histidinol phosphatase-like enzyme